MNSEIASNKLMGGCESFDLRWLNVSCLLGSVVVVGYVLWLTGRGLDFTDEGYYLLSISDPYNYISSFSHFGYFYHLFFLSIGENVAALRVFNVLITYALAFLLTALILRNVMCFGERDKFFQYSASSSFALLALLVVSLNGKWLATPSYNSLTLLGLLVIANGIVICLRSEHKASFIGWMLISCGGWLSFLGKPSSAALLALLVPLALFLLRRIRLSGIVIGLLSVSFLIYITLILLDRTLVEFIAGLSLNWKINSLQNSGHDLLEVIFRLGSFPTGARAMTFGVFAIVLVLLAWRSDTQAFIKVFPLYFAAVFIAGVIAQIKGIGAAYAKEAFIQLMYTGSLFFGSILLAINNRIRIFRSLRREHVVLSLLFLVFPHLYAFGTNNDTLVQASSAGFFWLLSGLVLLSPLFQDRSFRQVVLTTFASTIFFYSLFLVISISESPYRQSDTLRNATTLVAIGRPSSPVGLNFNQAEYVENLQLAARSANMPAGQQVIDLTGTSPGTLFSIGAKGVGLAWLIGGYPGSQQVVAEVFNHVSCNQLATAWILTNRDVTNPREMNHIDPAVLKVFGADLDEDYAVAAQWPTPFGARGNYESMEMLYRPIRSTDVINTCKNMRITLGG